MIAVVYFLDGNSRIGFVTTGISGSDGMFYQKEIEILNPFSGSLVIARFCSCKRDKYLIYREVKIEKE